MFKNKEKNSDTDRFIKFRITLIGVLFTFCFFIVAIKAIDVQCFKGEWLTQKAIKQFKKSFTVKGKRGAILDSSGMELAVSLESQSVAVNPTKIENKQEVAELLSKILKLNRRSLFKKISSDSSFVWVKRKITSEEEEKVKKIDHKGVFFIPEYKRFYPNRTLAAQLIGFSGLDGTGLEGLEYKYNTLLNGADTSVTVIKDALGRRLHTFDNKKIENHGNSIKLTLDSRVQYVAEKALRESAEKFDAESGMAVAMNPSTGEILALAHYPEFDPNKPVKRSKRFMLRNRAITDPFEPGSTMKVFLASTAIDTGISTSESKFYCENGSYKIGKNTVTDTHPHEWLTLQQVVQSSSNIGAVKISEETGKEVLYKSLRKFGFGYKTRVDFPGETSGILSNYRGWADIDAGNIAFGQGIAVSAIQLITAVSSIANGGKLMRPYIVSEVLNAEGKIIRKTKPTVVRDSISKKTADDIKDIMATVVADGGTGKKAALSGYKVCGKTGTAQKLESDGTYSRKKYIASFLGFAPLENPKIAVLVVIDEPKQQYYGSQVAAPAFKRITLATLNYLKVLPTNEINVAGRK